MCYNVSLRTLENAFNDHVAHLYIIHEEIYWWFSARNFMIATSLGILMQFAFTTPSGSVYFHTNVIHVWSLEYIHIDVYNVSSAFISNIIFAKQIDKHWADAHVCLPNWNELCVRLEKYPLVLADLCTAESARVSLICESLRHETVG